MQLTVQTWITLSTFTMQTADSYKQRFYGRFKMNSADGTIHFNSSFFLIFWNKMI